MTRRLLEHLNHELRSPLTVVVGMSELLAIKPASDERNQLLRSLRQATDVVLRILDEVVDFSRLESDSLRLDDVTFNLADACQAAVRSLAAGPGATELLLEIDPSVPQDLVGDPRRLSQIIASLARHAQAACQP